MIADNCSAERFVAEFGAPAELTVAIDAWGGEVQAVHDRSDPESSGFPDEATRWRGTSGASGWPSG